MSAVLTGRQRGTVRLILPNESDEQFVQGLVQAIWQLDHVENVEIGGRILTIKNDLAPHLRGTALTDTLIEFDNEITDVFQGMLSLLESETTMQAARQMVFSHR